jgi:hypothetical protein
VEWLDGKKEILFANTIAENMLAQADDEGNRHVLFHNILDHQKASLALEEHEAIEVLSNGFQQRKQTTKG